MGRQLRSLSELMPEFVRRMRPAEGQEGLFDFSHRVRTRYLAVATLGREIGWNARSLLTDQVVEHYWLRREIRLMRFQAALRQSILDTLNDGLGRIGKTLGLTAKIEISGLPCDDEYQHAESDLENGSRPFLQIVESLRI